MRLSYVTVTICAVTLMSACASDPVVNNIAQCPGELQVKINEGLHFGECRVLNTETVPKVSLGTADLLVYKNKNGFDLWSGAVDGDTLPLKKLADNTGGQIAQVYDSLADVPYRKPIASIAVDAQGRFFNVATGNGLVVQNNTTTGWTKIWVKQAISASEMLILQFETF